MSRAPVLNLTRLDLDRLPGIKAPFKVTAAPGVNLIIGPNEAGKSSVARAVFDLLWPRAAVATPFSVSGAFTDEIGPLQARRDDNEAVTWTRAGADAAAPDLPSGHVARCYRLGLLDLNRRGPGDLEHDLAREIRNQMAGGFDLPQVRGLFPDRSAILSRRQKEWSQARQELQQCQNRQKQLAEQERSLADRKQEYERAAQAARRLAQLQAARDHLALQARQAELELRLADLPAGMAQVRDGDDGILAELQNRRRDKTRQVQELKAAIAQRAERIAQLTVSGDLTELNRVVQQADGLADRVAETARALAAAEAAVAVARGDLDPELLAAETPAGSEAAFGRLVQSHREEAERRARADDLDHLLDLALLRSEDTASAVTETPPVPDVFAAGRLAPPRRSWLIAGALGLGTAVVLFLLGGRLTEDPLTAQWLRGFALLLAGGGATCLGLWLRGRQSFGRARRELENSCRAAGHPLPAGWTADEALAAFMERAHRAGEIAATQHTRGELRHELQRRRDDAHDALGQAVAARQDLLRTLGQDEHRAQSGLLHELDQVARWRSAHTQCAAARGAHDQTQSELAAALADGQRRLVQMGLEVEGTMVALQAALDKLREQQSLVSGLRETQAATESSLRQAEAELAAATASRQSLFQRLALPPLAAQSGSDEPDATELDQVTVRVAALPVYDEVTSELKTVVRDLERTQKDLAGGEDLLALSAAELEQRSVAEQHLAADAVEQSNEIARIEDRIARARRGNEWEQARARDAEKSADLAELLDEQRLGVLGRLLLDNVEQRHEHDAQPPLLTATNRHLALFTGGRYRLRVTGAGAAAQRFVAVDNADRPLELAELSDGTRAQLLLAARLAFLTSSEDGLQAPLFLDEALTASDPERFDAIAGAVGALAADAGRQVFYLTNSPADLAAWQQALARRQLPAAHVIDLAAERGLGDAASLAELEVPQAEPVPRPNGETAATYGAQLQVPPLRPWADVSDVHVFHLWRDDLDLVRRLVVDGVPTLGQWQRLGGELVHAGLFSADEAARITARGQLYGAFADVWRVGRGRPLQREDLVASEALSTAMLPMAVALLKEVDGDGEAFMAGVQAGKVKRLNALKKEALQDYLERHEHLDARAIRSPDDIVAHVLSVVSEPLASDLLAPDDVRQLVLSLHHAAVAG